MRKGWNNVKMRHVMLCCLSRYVHVQMRRYGPATDRHFFVGDEEKRRQWTMTVERVVNNGPDLALEERPRPTSKRTAQKAPLHSASKSSRAVFSLNLLDTVHGCNSQAQPQTHKSTTSIKRKAKSTTRKIKIYIHQPR